MSNSSPSSTGAVPDDHEWLEVVRQKVAKLRFGSVQITVHEGRVTQIESVEKTRFAPKARDGQDS